MLHAVTFVVTVMMFMFTKYILSSPCKIKMTVSVSIMTKQVADLLLCYVHFHLYIQRASGL